MTAAAAVVNQTPSAFSVFKKRNFTLLWSAQLVSTIGSSLTYLAAGILVFRVTGSALSVGLMLMATAGPTLVIGLIAGVFVDRYDRKRIMVASDLIRAVLVASIGLLYQSGAMAGSGILLLYLIVALSSGVTQFFDPANEAVLPEVATDQELAAANSLMSISSFGSTAVGFAAAGLIASKYPIQWAFFLDSLSFLFSAACISFVHVPKIVAEGTTNVATVVRNLRAGGAYLFSTPILRSFFFVRAPVLFSFGLWNVLLLPFALRALHATEFEYGLQEGLTSVGFVVGSLLMVRLADRWREGQWLTISWVGMGIVGIAYGLATSVPLAIVLVMISGFLNSPSAIAGKLIVQRNTPREMRGRVNSAFFVMRDMVFLAGMAAAGLADVIDIRLLVVVASVVVIGAGLVTVVLPGIGQPAAEWRHAMALLLHAPAPTGLAGVRPATLADFELLVGHLPVLGRLSKRERDEFVAHARVGEADSGATIVAAGDASNAAYFLVTGKVVAGTAAEDGSYRALSSMGPGDFFGEIAALTGSRRTASVVADEPSTLVELPAANLRSLMAVPEISQLVLSKLTERLARTTNTELPKLAGLDQAALRELRTEQPTPPKDGEPVREIA